MRVCACARVCVRGQVCAHESFSLSYRYNVGSSSREPPPALVFCPLRSTVTQALQGRYSRNGLGKGPEDRSRGAWVCSHRRRAQGGLLGLLGASRGDWALLPYVWVRAGRGLACYV